MEEVIEKYIFQIFVKGDQNSQKKLTIGDCIISCDISITDEQKGDIQKLLKKYIQLKKRHFTEKRIAINWNELSSML